MAGTHERVRQRTAHAVRGLIMPRKPRIEVTERGQEVLMSQPSVVRQMVQQAKTRANIAQMGNPNATKRDIVNAAGQQLGAEAADYLNQHIGPVGDVTDSYERVERLEPD